MSVRKKTSASNLTEITLYARSDPARARVEAAAEFPPPSSARDTVADLSDRLTVSESRSLESENFFRVV